MTDTTTLPETQSGSFLDQLHTIREDAVAAGEPLYIRMFGANQGLIALKFDYPEEGFAKLRRAIGGDQKPGQRRASGKQDDEAELKTCIRLLVACCTGVVEAKDGTPESEWPSIDPTGRDVPINKRLAELLQIDVPSDMRKGVSHHILRHLYSPQAHTTGKFNGDPTLMADGAALQEWLDAGGVKGDRELPGE